MLKLLGNALKCFEMGLNERKAARNEFRAIKNLPVDERWQLLALAGAGSFDPKLDSDPSNPVYTQWVHDSMTQKLASTYFPLKHSHKLLQS